MISKINIKLLILNLAILICAKSFGQNLVNFKPSSGSKLIELKINGLLSSPAIALNEQFGGILIRTFKTKKVANRLATDFKFQLGNNSKVDNICLYLGKEFHNEGTNRMSPYTGYAIGAGLDNSKFKISGMFFTGFDYYIAEGLYLGAEIGYKLNLGFNPGSVSSQGFGMNSSLKFGYILSERTSKANALNQPNSAPKSTADIDNNTLKNEVKTSLIKVDSNDNNSSNVVFLNQNNKFIEVYYTDLPNLMNWEDAKDACVKLGEGWRLPSMEEFPLIHQEIYLKGKSTFKEGKYWSAKVQDQIYSWGWNFYKQKNNDNFWDKSKELWVRPVRLKP